jgi:hypothetical protein
MKKKEHLMNDFFVFDVETVSFTEFKHENEKKDSIDFKFAIINRYTYQKENKKSIRTNSVLCMSAKELFDQLIQLSRIYYAQHKEQMIVYAHNIDFDILFIYQYVLESKFKRKQIRNHVIIKLQLLDENNRCFLEFRNSLVTFAMLSVEKLGKAIKMKKLEQNYDEGTNEQFIEYCQRDCDIVAFALTELMQLYNKYFGFEYYQHFYGFHVTVGSSMLQMFLTHCKESFFEIDEYLNNELRLQYFGGRTEAHDFNRHKSVECYDYNSFYASKMVQYKFPVTPYEKYAFTTITELNDEKVFLICCDVNDCNQIPLLVEKINGYSVIRSGVKHQRLLQKEEFDYFKENNQILTIHYYYKCQKMIYPFQYLNEIYNDRLDMKHHNNPLEYLIKIMVNNAYGRFGMRTERNSTELVTLNDIAEKFSSFDEFYAYHINLGHKVQQNRDNFTYSIYFTQHIFSENINVAIAMRITALTRLTITKLCQQMRSNDIPLIYMDTDSVFFSSAYHEKFKKIFASIIDEDRLGALKHEKTCKNFVCLALKAYEYTDKENKKKVKLKGVKDIQNLLDYYNSSVEQIHICKINESIRRNFEFGTKIIQDKSNQNYYSKRIIQTNLTTTPLRITTNINDVQLNNQRILENYHNIIKINK